jgi:pilus assembly protein CpaC
VAGLALACLVWAGPAAAQTILTSAESTIQIEKGKTGLMRFEFDLTQISVGDSTIANVVAVDPRQLMLNGLQVGATTLIIWERGVPRLYTIEVTADATALQSQLQTLFPGTNITVSTSGNAVILSGSVTDPTIARRATELATRTGAQVINNLQAPSAEQVLLHVRFAEIRRTSGSRIGVDLFAGNVAELDQVFGEGSTASIETLSEGLMRLFLIGQNADLEARIRALKSKGEYRSLAEPNLITMEGQEASFLAGGEFPFPTVQQGGAVGQVTITFKEFGIRLKFTPDVTNSGTVVLKVSPEVSSLDFANGLTFAGFQIPSLLTRRAESTVELRPGQHLAIAGLLDNTITDNVDKIPFLGDLPVLGALFRSKANDQTRTELLVLVTPHLVEASDVAPGLPTGEPRTWRWDRNMRMDTVREILPARRRSGSD